ncbi:ubiquitin/SUMO-activating enzyme E1 [Artemisia annua]|uniref:Ubiquitin/SUMO-activating enzyme E1 n=1 Tax=Artemisia annua TaxID=35608 RepID=A0A2U1L2F7_ARTAN|nr:ubiquitin/SUMO-activating enzyme E1 [Artemisia annua]
MVPLEPSDYKPLNSRYDAKISVFGAKFHKKLEDTRSFVVGTGALGCELLKNLALMGVSCETQGKLTVTDDDDVIEKRVEHPLASTLSPALAGSEGWWCQSWVNYRVDEMHCR